MRSPLFSPPSSSTINRYFPHYWLLNDPRNPKLHVILPTGTSKMASITNLVLARGRQVTSWEVKELEYKKVCWKNYLFFLPKVLPMDNMERSRHHRLINTFQAISEGPRGWYIKYWILVAYDSRVRINEQGICDTQPDEWLLCNHRNSGKEHMKHQGDIWWYHHGRTTAGVHITLDCCHHETEGLLFNHCWGDIKKVHGCLLSVKLSRRNLIPSKRSSHKCSICPTP